MPRTLYDVLEVPESASLKEIRVAYRKMTKEYHPDRLVDLPEHLTKLRADAQDRWEEIQEAWDVLSDSQKRTQYDDVVRQYHAQTAPAPGAAGTSSPPFAPSQPTSPQNRAWKSKGVAWGLTVGVVLAGIALSMSFRNLPTWIGAWHWPITAEGVHPQNEGTNQTGPEVDVSADIEQAKAELGQGHYATALKVINRALRAAPESKEAIATRERIHGECDPQKACEATQ